MGPAMNKDEVLKAHAQAFEAGARLARANEFLVSAKAIADKARLEVDHAGAEFHALSNAANRTAAEAFKAIGEATRKEQDAAIDSAQVGMIPSVQDAQDAMQVNK